MSQYKNRPIKKTTPDEDQSNILTLPDPVLDEKGPCKEDAFIRRFGFKVVMRSKCGGVLWDKCDNLYTQDEALAIAHREHRIKENMKQLEGN